MLGPDTYYSEARDIVNIEKDLAKVSIVNQSLVMETLKAFPVHHIPYQIFVSNEVRDPNLKYNPILLQQMQQTYWRQVQTSCMCLCLIFDLYTACSLTGLAM